MATMNISLPDDQKAFVDRQVAENSYVSSSEYIRALVRREQELQRFRDLIEEGRRSPLGDPIDESYFEQRRERIRAFRRGE